MKLADQNRFMGSAVAFWPAVALLIAIRLLHDLLDRREFGAGDGPVGSWIRARTPFRGDIDLWMDGDLTQPKKHQEGVIHFVHRIAMFALNRMIKLFFFFCRKGKKKRMDLGSWRSLEFQGGERAVNHQLRQEVHVGSFPTEVRRMRDAQKRKETRHVAQRVHQRRSRQRPSDRRLDSTTHTRDVTRRVSDLVCLVHHHAIPFSSKRRVETVEFLVVRQVDSWFSFDEGGGDRIRRRHIRPFTVRKVIDGEPCMLTRVRPRLQHRYGGQKKCRGEDMVHHGGDHLDRLSETHVVALASPTDLLVFYARSDLLLLQHPANTRFLMGEIGKGCP